jgi:hypothetical protein
MNDPALSTEIRRKRQDSARRVIDDDRVMSFALWCEVNGFSPATGRRLRQAGKGPVFTQLSERRIGVTVRNNRLWQQSRVKPEGTPLP